MFLFVYYKIYNESLKLPGIVLDSAYANELHQLKALFQLIVQAHDLLSERDITSCSELCLLIC